jgi:hypothetical protein
VELVNDFGFDGFRGEEAMDGQRFVGGNEEEVMAHRLSAQKARGRRCMVVASVGKGGAGRFAPCRKKGVTVRGWAGNGPKGRVGQRTLVGFVMKIIRNMKNGYRAGCQGYQAETDLGSR